MPDAVVQRAAPAAPAAGAASRPPGAPVELRGLEVCFVAGTLGQGGAERQLHYILRELVERDARPRLLCLTRGEFWEERIRALGVPVTWVGASPSRLVRLRHIVAELGRHRPHVLQSQHFYTNLYVAVAGRVLGVPEVGALRSDGRNEIAGTGALLGRASLCLPRTLAANSRAAIGNAVALGVPANRLHLLPNVVDTRRFVPRPRTGDAALRLVAVGRMGPEKRFDRLLRVLALARPRSPVPVRATLVGDGPLRGELQALAARLGLGADCLTLAGAAAEMTPHYQAADLLVLTSDWEGTPNVVLEAMACGLPVVATRVGGVVDLVRDGATGLLRDPGDEEGLAAAIVALAADAESRLAHGRRARDFVERHHAAGGLGDTLGALYAAAAAAAATSAGRTP